MNQKLLGELKNIPTDASQVCSSISTTLNKEETPSVSSIVLTNNDPDVNQSGNKENACLMVFVLNKYGKPLMPCKPAKASHLLKQGKVKVVKRNPFTIQWMYGCGGRVQKITLGIDLAYKFLGFSAVTDKKELIQGELILRTDISDKISERRMYRRQKRNKLWYRKPRWNNRASTKKEGWLAPSIMQKLNTHILLVDKIKKLLPISDVIVEVASFDAQKMVNPEISGIEYQQGELQGYEIREYLLEKFGRKCAYCGKKDVPLEIEHIIPKSRCGNSRVNNLTISCHKCNQKKGDMTAEEFRHSEVQTQAQESLKATAFMNNIRWKLVNTLGCKWTYGYITKHNRIKLGLRKSHSNDAFVIANGINQIRSNCYLLEQKRKNNRCLQLNRKGHSPSIKKQRHQIRPRDLVWINNIRYNVLGVFNLGKWIRVVDKLYSDVFNFSVKKVQKVFHTGCLIWN